MPTSITVSSSPFPIPGGVFFLAVDTNAPRQLNLPNPANPSSGTIADKTGLAFTNNITLHPFAGEKINGTAGDLTLSSNNGIWTWQTDGTDWYVSQGSESASGVMFEPPPVTTSIVGQTTLVVIPLKDDTMYKIDIYIVVRNAGTAFAVWTDSIDYYRAGGSGATNLGSSNGPKPYVQPTTSLSATLSGTWIDYVPVGNGVFIQSTTSDTNKAKFIPKIWVQPVPATAAV